MWSIHQLIHRQEAESAGSMKNVDDGIDGKEEGSSDEREIE